MSDLKIGTAEARFADIIWEREPITSGQMAKIGAEEFNWKESTSHTVLRRLCERGLFKNEDGTVTSLISREEYYARHSERINDLSKWKKPAAWVMLIAVVACAILSISLLTDPAAEREFPINGSNVSELDTEVVLEKIAKAEGLENSSQLLVSADNFDLMFTSDFNWANDGAIRFLYGQDQKYYSAQLRMFHDDNKYFITDRSEWIEPEKIFLLSHYLDALKYMPQEEIRQLSLDADGYSVFLRHEGTPGDHDRILKYDQNGVQEGDGWLIHLEVQPLHEVEGGTYNGSGDEAIHLFFDPHDSEIQKNTNATPTMPRDMLIDSGEINNKIGLDMTKKLNKSNGRYVDLYVENNGSNSVVATIDGQGERTFEPGEKGHIYVEVTQGHFGTDKEYVFKVGTGTNGGSVNIHYEITQRDAQ